MLAAGLTIFLCAGVFTFALCKAAGQADEKERQWVQQRKKEEKQEFDGYKYCDDYCYRCTDSVKCEKAVKRE